MAEGAVDRRVIAVALAAPLLAVAVVVGASVGGGPSEGSGPTTVASAPPTSSVSTVPPGIDVEWNGALETALQPLAGALTELASGVDRWSTGGLDDAGLATLLDDVASVLRDVHDDASALPVHPSEPLAAPLVETTTELYVLAVDAHRAALDAPDDDLADQYDRLGRRLRILADRTFDRARERTAAPIDPGPDVRLVLPAEVPDWTRLELAAGPPLEPASTDRADETPLGREDERASQPEDAWIDAVMALDVPASADVRTAFGDADRLAAQARMLVASAEAMRTIPVPDDDRGRADRVALGWLLAADGARAAQLAALIGTDTTLAGTILDLAEGEVFSIG